MEQLHTVAPHRGCGGCSSGALKGAGGLPCAPDRVRAKELAQGAIEMTKITDEPRSGGQYSPTILWISLFSVLLLLAVFLESLCLGVLYLNDSLKGKDKNLFLEEHILTKPFASNPINPDPNP